MTRRTLTKIGRAYEEIKGKDVKGKETKMVIRRATLAEPIPREEYVCQCGRKYMVSIGQRIVCRHGLTKKEMRARVKAL